MSTEEIVKYYKDKWGPIEDKYESVSAKAFELIGTTTMWLLMVLQWTRILIRLSTIFISFILP